VDLQGRKFKKLQYALAAGKGGGPARWVYVPTATDPVDGCVPPSFTTTAGATVSVLHTRDRRVADSDTFVAPLRSATAVFFEGGRQWRLVDAYAGTRTEHELRAVLDRGGLISGTSAGATIQGSYLVRGSPLNNTILMSPGHERGFGYLANVAIDQHVVAWRRQNDLARVIAAHPGLLGIGIDEGTAAIVQQNTMTVIGCSVILITDGAVHDGKPYYALRRGTRFDLASWTVIVFPVGGPSVPAACAVSPAALSAFDQYVGKTCTGVISFKSGTLAGKKVPVVAKFFRKPDSSSGVSFKFDQRDFVNLPVSPRDDELVFKGQYSTWYTLKYAGPNHLSGHTEDPDGGLELSCI
jgi:cyanophycinase